MRVKLVRDNDDPKLLADLERLAGREPVVIEEVADEGTDAGAEAASAAPEPLDDPFVRRFVQISVHLKRYAPFYAGAAVWALTMLLIHPLGKGSASDVASGPGYAGQSVPVATASADSAVADLGADAVAAPTFEAVTGASFSDTSVSFDDLSSSDTELAGSDTSSSFDSGSTSSDFSSTDTTITFDDEFGSDEPKQLMIVRSGYASVTGGTPAEQQPANGGLPVAVTAGNNAKVSFIEIEGEGSQLRLKVASDDSSNLQADTAVIKLCGMSSGDWKAERGQAMPSTAPWDSSCSTGSLLDGVWTFDISGFSTTDRANGFALVPGQATPPPTFQVVFEPIPEPTENA
jgi:hypothetical protein